MLRTRTRTQSSFPMSGNLGVGNAGVYHDFGGTRYYPPYVDLAYAYNNAAVKTLALSVPLDTSTIIDEISRPSDVRRWHYVRHAKIERRQGTLSRVMTKPNPPYGDGWYVIGGIYSLPPSVAEAEIPSIPVEGSTTLHNWRAKAYADLIPKLENKGGLNLLNTVLEFRDVGKLYETCRRTIPAVANVAREIVRREGKSAFKRSSKTAADLTLSYDFGLRPLVRDAAVINLLYGEIAAHVAKLQQRGLVAAVHHAGPYYTRPTSSTTTEIAAYVRTYRTTRYSAQAELTYSFPNFNMSDAIVEYLGLNLTADRMWDVIPFSFVVDWFYNIGDSLQSLDRAGRAVPRVSQFSETIESVICRASFPRCDGYTLKYFHSTCPPPPYGDREYPLSSGISPTAWTLGKIYERKPTSWGTLYNNPFSHVELPELKNPFNGFGTSRFRDALSLIGQCLGK